MSGAKVEARRTVSIGPSVGDRRRPQADLADLRLGWENIDVPKTFTDPLTAPSRNAFLNEVLASLGRRRKAIRHKARFTVEKVVERTDGDEREKLEITCALYFARDTSVRLFAWQDRWLWVDARSFQKSEGWIWQFTARGRAIGGLDGRSLVAALEASIAASSQVNEENAALLQSIWQRVLAVGPSVVK